MKKGGYQQYTSSRDYRNAVRLLYKDKLYKEGYKLCLKWLNKIKYGEVDVSNKHIWGCYYNLGSGMWYLKEYDKGLCFLEKALCYADAFNDNINTCNVIAMCHEDKGNKEKALEQYNKCILLCDEKLELILDTKIEIETKDNILKSKAALLRNIGELLSDESLIYDSISIYKLIQTKDKITQEILEDKIQRNYKILCEIYIKNNNIILASKMINYITNKNIKEQLSNKVQA